jgi:hypothetical protein
LLSHFAEKIKQMETQVKDQEEEPAKIPEPAIPTEVTQH